MISLRQIAVACFIIAATCVCYDGISGLPTSSTVAELWIKLSPTSFVAVANLVEDLSMTLWEGMVKPILTTWAFAFFSGLGILFLVIDLFTSRSTSSNRLAQRS